MVTSENLQQGTSFAAFCFPACVFGANMALLAPGEAMFAGDSCVSCLVFYLLYSLLPCTVLVHAQARRAIRARYQLPPDPCADEIVTCFCVTCALQQVKVCRVCVCV